MGTIIVWLNSANNFGGEFKQITDAKHKLLLLFAPQNCTDPPKKHFKFNYVNTC